MSDKSWGPGMLWKTWETHSQHAEQLLFSCLCSKVTPSLSHSVTLTLSISHSLSWHAVNNFCFHVYAHCHTLSHCRTLMCHVYAQKSLFYSRKCQLFFGTSSSSSPSPVSLRVHRAGSQLKSKNTDTLHGRCVNYRFPVSSFQLKIKISSRFLATFVTTRTFLGALS